MTTLNNGIKFKTDRQKLEFEALAAHNPALLDIGNQLAQFISSKFHKDIVVTDVFRTLDEFNKLYESTPVEKRPAASPHCYWSAFDLRSRIYTEDEIKQIVAWLNSTFKNPSGKATALYHTITGNVAHLHVQNTKA